MPAPARRTLWLLTASSFYAFVIFGFVDNLKGPSLPALLQELRFSYSQGGAILLAAYVGFLVATLVAGLLSDVAGRKAPLYVAGASLLIGIAGYGALHSFWGLMAAVAAIGFGLGSIELGANAMIIDLHRERKGRYLNLLAVFHGLGSMAAPLYAGQLLAAGTSWRRVYHLSLAPVALLPLCFLLLRYPRPNGSASREAGLRSAWRSACTARMAWFYLLIATYVAAEVGAAAWMVEFLQQAKGQSVVQSATFLSLFFAAITVGRLLGSLVVERLGYLRIMLVAALGAVACLALGTLGPPALALLVPLTGLFFSIVFPTTTAAVSDLHRENSGTVLGLLFTFAGLGGMLGPWAIGVGSDLLGIELGFGLLVVFCLLMAASLLALMAPGRNTAYAAHGRGMEK